MTRPHQNRRLSALDSGVRLLDRCLWNAGSLLDQSRDFRPLYVHRYQGIRPETRQTRHRFWEIICVRRGSGVLHTAKSRQPLEKGMLFLVAPDAPHMEHSDVGIDLIWMGFELEKGGHGVRMVSSGELSDEMERLWILTEQRRVGTGAEIDGRARTLTARLYHLHEAGAGAEGGDVIERAIRYIHDNFSNAIAIPAMARQFGCSEGYFYRLFRKRTGRTPVRYLTEVRVRHARRLIEETGMPIKEIATLAGFDDPLYFSRVFRKENGTSPQTFRTGR